MRKGDHYFLLESMDNSPIRVGAAGQRGRRAPESSRAGEGVLLIQDNLDQPLESTAVAQHTEKTLDDRPGPFDKE